MTWRGLPLRWHVGARWLRCRLWIADRTFPHRPGRFAYLLGVGCAAVAALLVAPPEAGHLRRCDRPARAGVRSLRSTAADRADGPEAGLVRFRALARLAEAASEGDSEAAEGVELLRREVGRRAETEAAVELGGHIIEASDRAFRLGARWRRDLPDPEPRPATPEADDGPLGRLALAALARLATAAAHGDAEAAEAVDEALIPPRSRAMRDEMTALRSEYDFERVYELPESRPEGRGIPQSVEGSVEGGA